MTNSRGFDLSLKQWIQKTVRMSSCGTLPEWWYEALLQETVLCQWKTPLHLVLVVLLHESISAGKMELHKSKTEKKPKSSLVLGRKLLFNFLLQLMLAALFHIPRGLPVLFRIFKFFLRNCLRTCLQGSFTDVTMFLASHRSFTLVLAGPNTVNISKHQ